MSDLAILAADTDVLDQSSDPATFVVLACGRAKDWLTQAVERGDIDQIVELKSQAEAIRIYTTQKQLGKDAELAAAEIVRRAERGIGVSIRRGQEAGDIKRAQRHGDHDKNSISPTAWLRRGEETTNTYAVTDNVTDEQYDEVIEEAKEEGNLSRANVVRKITSRTPAAASRVDRIRALAGDGHNSRQIAEVVGVGYQRVRELAQQNNIPLADATIGRTRRVDANRVMAEATAALEAVVLGTELIEVHQLDPTRVEDWATSLSNSLRSLNRLCKQLKEIAQ